MNTVSPGRFIVVEGLEGAGKSTIVSALKKYLIEKNIDCITTREPGGTQIAESLREIIKMSVGGEKLDPRTELLLIYAARVQLLEHVIRPALLRGQWVIADRFEMSTYAYQGGGRQLPLEIIDHLSQFCVADMQPDLTFFLDISPQHGLARALARGAADRIEQESMAFFNRVYDMYQQRVQAVGPTLKRLDATLAPEVLLAEIAEALAVFAETKRV